MRATDLSRRSLADKYLYRALVLTNAYQCAKFQLPSSISFLDRGVPKFNVGATTLLAVPHTLKFLRVLQVLRKIKQPAKFQHRTSMHHAVMRIYISHRLSIMCTQKWSFWGFWGWRCENTVFVLTPKRHYPAWIRVCWCISCQNRLNGLSSRSVERFCVHTKKQSKKIEW